MVVPADKETIEYGSNKFFTENDSEINAKDISKASGMLKKNVNTITDRSLKGK
jgi:hypothetical protein